MDFEMKSQVVFADNGQFDGEFDDIEIEFEQTSVQNKPATAYANPYSMNRHKVHVNHFIDARLYDTDLNNDGWKISHQEAHRKYKKWLQSVREIPGWDKFRREHRELEPEDNGKEYRIRKYVPVPVPSSEDAGEVVLRPNVTHNRNRKQRLLPQSRDKGVNVTDEDFRPKMFTGKMGKEISQIRHSLDMTQADLAKKVNVDAHVIRNIELGDLVTFNSEDVMVKELARALGLPSIKYQE